MVDYIELDGTDFAHPAYWRGSDAAVKGLCSIITEILDGKTKLYGVARDPEWQKVRERLAGMVEEHESFRFRLHDLGQNVD